MTVSLGILARDPARWTPIAQRLRDVEVTVGDTIGALAACQAIVCVDAITDVNAALASGKRILVAASAVPRSEQSSDRLAVVNVERYRPSLQLIRQQLDAGKLGVPGLLRIHRWASRASLELDLDLALWYFGKAAEVVYAVSNSASTQV